MNGDYLTAEDGGGRASPPGQTFPVRTDATSPGPTEGFRVRLLSVEKDAPGCSGLPPDWYQGCPIVSLQTPDGVHYLSVSNHPAHPHHQNDKRSPLHTGATRVFGWETFLVGPFEP